MLLRQVNLHTLGGLVQTIPQTIDLKPLRTTDIGDFISKKNDIVYFNPSRSSWGCKSQLEGSVSIGKSYTTW